MNQAEGPDHRDRVETDGGGMDFLGSARSHRARRGSLAVLALGTTFVLTSCGSTSEARDVPVVGVELGRYTISPAVLGVPAGEIDLRVTNTDSMVHNIVVAGRGTRNLNPGETQVLPVVVEVGDYRMWCDVPGHADMGQTATLSATLVAASTPDSAPAAP
jgi:plastocyanin